MRIVIFLLLFSAVAFSQSDLEIRRQSIERLTSSDPESAFKAISKIALENKNADDEIRAKIESTRAMTLIYLANLDDAEKKNNWSLSVHSKTGEAAELSRNYMNRALISERRSDYVQATEYFLKSIAQAEKARQYTLIQKGYRGLSMMACEQRDYNKALDYINRSLSYQQLGRDQMQEAYSLAAKGEIYRLKGEIKTAHYYLKSAYDSFANAENDHGRAWVLTNWALCYDNDALKYTRMTLDAQEIWDRVAPENTMSIVNLGNIAYNYMVMARDSASLTKGHPEFPQGKAALLNEAEKYFNRSLALARKKKNLNAIIYQANNLAGLQYMKGDYKSAIDNLSLTMRLSDSIYSQQNKNKIAALESEKKILIRDEKIRLDQIRLENHRHQQYYLMGGIALLGCIGILLYRQSQNRKKNNLHLLSLNEQLDQANKVKARFFSILNHDLRRPVYNLIHFLQLQKESPELLDAESRDRIESQTLHSAENLLASMEDLLLWSKGQMEHFKPEFDDVRLASVFSDVQKHFSGFSTVRFVVDLDDADLTFNTDRNYLLTILRNLVGNAIKAMEKTPDPTVTLKARSQHGISYISVSDNGPGADSQAFKALYDDSEVQGIGSGLGLHIIRDMAQAVGCTVSVDSTPGVGTTFTIGFK